MSETIEQIDVRPESESEARARFTQNYRNRCCDVSMEWLAAHIEPLIRIAVPAARTTQPRRRRPGPKPKEAPLPWGRLVEMFQGQDQESDRAEALV